MVVDRRRMLSLTASAALAPLVARRAFAEAYPTRPVRVLVGFPPGGGADTLTRTITDWLQTRLAQPFIVENRPGAGTNLATEAVVRAPADGYTLLATTTSNLLNGALYANLKYDFVRDIAPVASVSIQPLVLVAPAATPLTSVPAFVAYAKAHPGKVNLGNFGAGTISHVAAEALKIAAGIDVVSVPYRGSAPMLTDLLGGRIQAAIDNIPGTIEHIRTGSLRALAVTTANRAAALPNVPTLGEFVTGYEAYTVAGFGAPRGTPTAIVETLNKEINSALTDPRVRTRLAELGSSVLPGSAADFARLIARETEKWEKVIRTARIKID